MFAAGTIVLAAGAVRADTRMERTLKLAPGGRLVVDTSLGEVKVQGTAEPDARVVITSDEDLNDLLTFRFDEEPGLARIVAKSRHTITFFHGRVRFEIQVPAKTRSEIHTSGGAIKLFSLEDSARLDTSGGGIEVNDLGGELDAHTSGGSIHVANVRGRAKLDTSGGGITVRDLTGALRSWIEIGNPDPAPLHRASKASPRVAVYTYRDIDRLTQNLAAAQIHRAADLELYAIDRRLIDAIAERLDRRTAFTLSVSDRELFVSLDSGTVSGKVTRASAL